MSLPSGEPSYNGDVHGEHIAIGESLVVAPSNGRLRRVPLAIGTPIVEGMLLGRVDMHQGGSREVRAFTSGRFLGWLAWEGEPVVAHSPLARLQRSSNGNGAAPERATALARGDVDVWRLTMEPGNGPDLRQTSQVSVRSVIGQYVAAEPSQIRFDRSSRGKPSVADPEWSWVRFSVSYTRSTVVVAVTRDAEVGVDVETVRPVAGWQRVAQRWLLPSERDEISHAGTQDDAFLQVWTRHEARLKAIGSGSPGAVFCTAPSRPQELVSTATLATNDLQLGHGLVGAVAVEGGSGRIHSM